MGANVLKKAHSQKWAVAFGSLHYGFPYRIFSAAAWLLAEVLIVVHWGSVGMGKV
jgi:hypothetical protein